MEAQAKPCKKCGAVKPMEDFHRTLSMKDGRRTRCKECSRKPKEVAAEQNRRYASTPEGKAKRVEAARSYRARNPVRYAARALVHNAIRAGRIVRQPCEACGSEDAHAHHDDYNKPLDVRWLCRTHHQEWHEHNTPIYPEDERSAA